MGGRARSARWFSCTIVRFDFPPPGVVVGVVTRRPSVLRCPSFCMAPPVADAVDIGGQWVKRRQVAARPVSRARPRFATLDARGVKAWVHGGGADVAEGAGNSRGVSRGGASVQPDVCRRCSTAVFNDRVQRRCSTTTRRPSTTTLPPFQPPHRASRYVRRRDSQGGKLDADGPVQGAFPQTSHSRPAVNELASPPSLLSSFRLFRLSLPGCRAVGVNNGLSLSFAAPAATRPRRPTPVYARARVRAHPRMHIHIHIHAH